MIIASVREAGRHYLKDSQLTTNYPLLEIDEDRDATPLPPPQLSTVKLLILYFLLLSFSIKKYCATERVKTLSLYSVAGSFAVWFSKRQMIEVIRFKVSMSAAQDNDHHHYHYCKKLVWSPQ